MIGFCYCSASAELGERVWSILRPLISSEMVLTPDSYRCSKFSDGEFLPKFESTVRGVDLFILQSTVPTADNLMELLLAVDAAKRASACSVTAVIPYFGWARQDCKDQPRVPIGAKLVAGLLERAGVDRVITIDLHADQIQGFFQIPVDHLHAASIVIPYLKKNFCPDYSVIVSPDMGGAKRAHRFANELGCPLVLCHKVRVKANEVDSITVIGDVDHKVCYIVDDMIDTAGTICKTMDALYRAGASLVNVVATHAVLSGPAISRFDGSEINEIIITDTVPGCAEKFQKSEVGHLVETVSVADMLAHAIQFVYQQRPIASLFL